MLGEENESGSVNDPVWSGCTMARIILDSRPIVVTGGGSGIGQGIAVGLAECGATIVAVDINLEHAQETADRIVAKGGKAIALQLDVSDLDQCREVAAQSLAQVGPAYGLVNSAGVRGLGTIDDPGVAKAWADCMNVNATGSFYTSLAWLDQLRETRGSIINIASISGMVTTRTFPGYNASKAAAIGLTKSMADKLAKDGVRVNAILPGAINTPMTVNLRSNPANIEYFLGRTPLKRFGEPEDFIGPAAFLLAGDLSAYVTGATLAVDGGLLAE